MCTTQDKLSHRNESFAHLCETAQLVASALDGASERAVLVADDGTILYMNPAASHFLCKTSAKHVLDFLLCDKDEDWKQVKHCRVIMKSGESTRNERNISLTKLEKACSCCNQQYWTMYICSRHERVREVVDHAFDSVLTVDESRSICTVNTAATELFGYTEIELVGSQISVICPAFDEYMKTSLELGISENIGKKHEVFGVKKNGQEFPIELGIQEFSDANSGKRYFCGFMKDLTMLKYQQAQLLERQALAEGMISASFEPMMEIDETGTIKIVNAAACSLFGYSREEFIGNNISMICGDGHASRHAGYMKRYMDTGVKRIIGMKRQVKARRKDGAEIEVELGVQEVNLSGGRKAFCGYIRDLTQQKKDKRALKKQAELIHGKFFGGEDGPL
jgi:PAS domain S-box-containing protein